MEHGESLYSLRRRRQERDIKGREPSIRSDAKEKGIKGAETADVWTVLYRLNNWYDEQRRPELEERARALGIRWIGWRSTLGLRLAIHDEETRRRLIRELGD